MIKQCEEIKKNINKTKISTRQGGDYTTGCLLDYVYFKDDFRLIAVDLSEQKALDADPKAIQQITSRWSSLISFLHL